MKKLLLLSCMLPALIAQALPLNKKKNNRQPIPAEQQLPYEVWAQQQERQAHKTTAVQKRLVAKAYTASGDRIDSLKFIYNNNVRGSRHPNINSYNTIFSFSSNAINDYIQCDTMYRWYDNNGSLDLYGTHSYTYNNNNKVTKVFDNYFQYGYFNEEGTYNNNGLLTEHVTLDTFGGTALVPKRRSYIQYDRQNRRVYDSSHNILTNIPGIKRVYNYDANGNLDTFWSYYYTNNAWRLSMKRVCTYDAQNRMLSSTYESDYGQGFMTQFRSIYTYSGNATFQASEESQNWDNTNNVWVANEKMEYTLRNNQLPDAYIIFEWDDFNQEWDTIERDVYTYDANDLLLRSNGYLYMGGGQFSTTPYDQSNLYYEDHDPSSVNNIAATKNKVELYPNPASGTVNITVQAGAARVTIGNMSGQVVYHNNKADKNVEVNTASWPAGNYWVKLDDATGHTIAASVFTKH